MHREPSIHVTESLLTKLIGEMLDNFSDDPDYPLDKQVSWMLVQAKKYQLSNRKLLATNAKLTQKAKVIAKSPLADAMLMAKAIYLCRKEIKHRGIEVAKPGTRDFTIIKNITDQAMEFSELLGIDNQKAFIIYVQTYLKMMGNKFNLITLQNKAEQVIEYYLAQKQLKSDDNKAMTERAYRKYNQCVISAIGELLAHYDKDPAKYKYFVQVGKECKRLNIEPENYIQAQFDGLEWTKGIPEPTQLVGPKALERLQKWLYANKDRIKKVEGPSKENVNKLKNLKKLK